MDTTAGKPLLLCLNFDDGQTITDFIDSKGNVVGAGANDWNLIGTYSGGGGSTWHIYGLWGGLGGTGHTVQTDFSGTAYPVGFLLEFDDALTGASPWGTLATSSGGGGSPHSFGSGTLAQADNLLLTANGGGWNSSSVAPPWSTVDSELDNGAYWTAVLASLNVNSTTSQSATWTWAGGGPTSLFILPVKSGAGGGGTTKTTATPAAGAATVSATAAATARTTATPAAGSATVSATTAQAGIGAEVWGYMLPNGKTAGQNLAEINAVLTDPVEGDIDLAGALRVLLAVAAGKTSIVPGAPGTATVEFRAVDDSETRVSADMVGSERVDVTITP